MQFDNNIAIAILMGTFVIMIIMKIPVTFSLAVSSGLTMIYCKISLMALIQTFAKSVNSFSLLAIPFFILCGEIMGAGGISDRMLNFANVIVGRFQGGLAHVNCLASMFFGGVSGSAVADVSSLGTALIPMMKNAGYDEDFSVGITVTSACQGVLIPPSHNMIIYAVSVGGLAGGVSVRNLFMGGVIPGVSLGLALMGVCAVISYKRNYPKGEKVSLKDAIKISRDAILALFTAAIILFGVTFGLFTATESGAIACLYALFISMAIYRELKPSYLPVILMKTVKTLAMVFSLIGAAGVFGWMMAYLRVPVALTKLLLNISNNKIVILLLINALLLFLGCIMDMAPLILIMTPILLPVVTKFGMNTVQFGIMLILNLAVGLCTPPVGSALFVGCSIGKIPIEKTVKAMLPMYLAMVVVLLMVTFIPGMSLWLPGLIYGVK
ncbi:MAG: TRAP transporter large permease [Fusobacteriaceae bacterium]|jgi:tripartite ATP-independent transporter DctM subunit|nr:TRAP transporter large permease [Fusobacteriaceae bacterium]